MCPLDQEQDIEVRTATWLYIQGTSYDLTRIEGKEYTPNTDTLCAKLTNINTRDVREIYCPNLNWIRFFILKVISGTSLSFCEIQVNTRDGRFNCNALYILSLFYVCVQSLLSSKGSLKLISETSFLMMFHL